ncbi:MAG: hypothetical protein AB1817_06530 [Chloroflexota bacterium]
MQTRNAPESRFRLENGILLFGLALVAIFWFASWTHLGALGEYAFFPLWLGYILVVDALVARRTGASLLTRAPREFVALFLLSAPLWWIFEFHNYFLLNWHYLGARDLSFWEMLLVGTIDFSTVIPAVFETRALIATFATYQKPVFVEKSGFSVTPRGLWLTMYGAVFLFAGVLFLPRYFFPFTWIWLFLFVDALNCLRGRASLIEQASRGDWRNVVTLALAGVVCGFFWEMWNIFALPKWYYTVPFVNFAKIFEMPLLGYGGYVPFAWELYALYHFVWGVLRRPTHVK